MLRFCLRFTIRVRFGITNMDVIQASDDCSVSGNVRANIFLRVRNTVGFQVLEHCNVDIMGSACFEYSFRLRFRVRNRVGLSLPVYWSTG